MGIEYAFYYWFYTLSKSKSSCAVHLQPPPLQGLPGLLGRMGLIGCTGPYRTKTKDDFASCAAGHSSPVTRHFHRSVHGQCAVAYPDKSGGFP
jgi:hypothetical protein